MRHPLRALLAVTATALALVLVGGAVGVVGATGRPPATDPETDRTADAAPTDVLAAAITRAQERLKAVPGDWRTWATLGGNYLEWARVTADPTYYPRAEGAARRSLDLRPTDNADALVVTGALANARHDFAAARAAADQALAINGYDAAAYGVLADALTQLGDPTGATAAVQRMLDLRPGLAAYARGSYDLEQRGQVGEAGALMRMALAAATERHDVAFCQVQLGDLGWLTGDLRGAGAAYAAALAADPSSVPAGRGAARVAYAAGATDDALAGYAELTARMPTSGYLLEYADLLRAAGRSGEADRQLALAGTAHRLFTDNGGDDGLAEVALAVATGRTADALAAATGEWGRRQHADVADALAWSLHLTGRDTEALPYARRAVATGNPSAAYAYHLGVIAAGAGLPDEARRELRRALDTNPAFAPLDAPAARRALDTLGTP